MNFAHGWVGSVALLVGLLGCSGSDRLPIGIEPGTGGETSVTGGRTGTGGVGQTGGMPSSGAFQVSLEATPNSVCPGECVTVRARVSDGVEPYVYAWNVGESADGSSLQLCPEQTTQVAVTVSDSTLGNSSVEFGSNGTVSDEVTVTVRERCSDAMPTDPDGGMADAGPITTARDCNLVVSATGQGAFVGPRGWERNHTVTALSDGGYMIVGSFLGQLPLVEPPLQSQGLGSGFVARVDEACQVRWARALGGISQVKLESVEATEDGGAIITGTFDGSFDPGTGLLAAPAGYHAGLVMAVDGDGNTRWARAYGSAFRNCEVHSASIGAQGRVVIAGHGGIDTTIALGPLGAFGPFFAKLEADGTGLWAHAMERFNLGTAVAVIEGDKVGYYGYGTEPAIQGSPLPTNGKTERVIGYLQPDGRFSLMQGVSPSWTEGTATLNRMAFSSDQETLVAYTTQEASDPARETVVLERFSGDVGDRLGDRTVLTGNEYPRMMLGPVATSDGHVLLAGTVSGSSATSEGRPLAPGGGTAAYLFVYENDLTPVLLRKADAEGRTYSWGAARSKTGQLAHFYGEGEQDPNTLHLDLLPLPTP